MKVTRTCAQPGCTASQDGKCLEGLGDECPHAVAVTPAAAVKEKTERGAVSPSRPMVDLRHGAALDVGGAAAVMQGSLTRVIVFAGEPDSGKTTLLTGIYELFQSGSFAGFRFAGSRTLAAFEERAHLARIASGRSVADTERTKAGGPLTFLHLRLRGADGPRRDLLFHDIPGETCKLARDSTEECLRLRLLGRADRLVVLLDGARVASPDTRNGALHSATRFLRSCLDAGVLLPDASVDVLTSKWDLLHGDEGAVKYIHHAEESVRLQVGPRVRALRCLRIATRPRPKSDLSFGHGLADTFADWVEPIQPERRPDPARSAEGREFDRYLVRVRSPR